VKGAQIFQQRASHKREHFKQNDSSSFSKLEIDYKIMRLHNRRKVCTYLTGFFLSNLFFPYSQLITEKMTSEHLI